MTTSAASIIAAMALAACLVSCRDDPPAPPLPPAPRPATSVSARRAPPPPDSPRTIEPAGALRNFEAQFKQYERALAAKPGDLAMAKAALGAYQNKLAWLGSVKALDRVIELGERAVAQAPKDPAAYLLRASARGTSHRFADGLKDLEQAERLGARRDQTAGARATLLAGLGRYDEALPLLRRLRKANPSTVNLALEAMCLGRMLRHAEADKLFEEAEGRYRDVSPFVLAWLYFERGSMWERAGDADKARAFYQAALDRMPAYAHAVGHLARLVPPEQGSQLLTEIVKTSDDPEYLGLLAGLQERLAPGTARPLYDKARAGYAALVKKHPLAFADHAGWFYLVVAGEPDKAMELAELNFDNRQLPEAYELLIAALVATGDRDEACRRAEEGLGREYPSRGLERAAARAFDACGKKDRAAELRRRLARPPGR